MVKVEKLTLGGEAGYQDFVDRNSQGTLFYGLKYRNLLTELLSSSEEFYLVASLRGVVVGVLPAFVKRSRYGNILNSLPFYGSHGGALTLPGYPEARRVKEALVKKFHQIALEESCVTSTLITPLLDDDAAYYEEQTCFDFRDERIGQITVLPEPGADLDARLMEIFHSKTRNMVRKAYKSDISWRDSNSESDLRFLCDLHIKNCAALGIVSKGLEFFSLVPQCFAYGEDYKIYIASRNDQRIAALLVFFCNLTVEYYTPCIVDEYRSLQPLSLLIFEAMKQAVSRGYRYWNWGGTATNLEGIYRFKNRWGARDINYYYYIKKHADSVPLLKLGKARVLDEYKYFYALPFSLFEP